MKTQGNMAQLIKKKSPETNPKETDIYELIDK